MYDAFGSGSRPDRVLRRRAHHREVEKFSPSFGVHAGLIPDPNWPPVIIPPDSTAMKRRFRRVRCELVVEVDGSRRRAPGDLSQGGAMVLLEAPLTAAVIGIEFDGMRADARVLSATPEGLLYAHHVQFIDEEAGRAVWRRLSSR